MWLGASRCVVSLPWYDIAIVSTTYAARSRGSGPGGLLVRVHVVRLKEPPPARAAGGALPAAGVLPTPRGAAPVMLGSGPPVGPSFGKSASSDRETAIPSRTSAAAALRLAGVIRLTVPA